MKLGRRVGRRKCGRTGRLRGATCRLFASRAWSSKYFHVFSKHEKSAWLHPFPEVGLVVVALVSVDLLLERCVNLVAYEPNSSDYHVKVSADFKLR